MSDEATLNEEAPTSLGPLSYENWQKARAGKPWKEIVECPLFSDASIVELGKAPHEYGPYLLLNTLYTGNYPPAEATPGPIFVLRLEYFLGSVVDYTKVKTNVERYH